MFQRHLMLVLSFAVLLLGVRVQLAVAQPAASATAGLTIAQLRQQVDVFDATHGEENSRGYMEEGAAIVATWWDANANANIKLTAYDLWWILEHFHRADESLDDKNFSVKWTGLIKAPVTGEYTFSVSPFNINLEHGQHFLRQSTTVQIGGQMVLNSTPDAWEGKTAPIPLTAGAEVPIEVNFSYERSYKDSGTEPAIAILNWSGPGLEKSLVPNSALIQPAGGGNGLLAEYSSLVDGALQTCSRVEPTIDRYWFHNGCVMPKYAEQQAAVVERFWTLVTSPAYFKEWSQVPEGNDGSHPFHFRKAAGFVSLQQRADAIPELLQRPDVLQVMSWGRVKGLFNVLRVGSPDGALELLGSWAQLHPDAEPILASNFYDANRSDYRYLSISIVWQHPSHLERFQNQYLELPDGSCSLPVAYAAAYGHLVLGESGDRHLANSMIVEWIELLDAKLDDGTLTGERRVNWLLARAQAEEIRDCPPERHFIGLEKLRAGRGWLDEAALIAELPATQLRVAKEIAFRLAAIGQWEAAKKWLQEQSPSSTSQEDLAGWNANINAIEVSVKEFQENEKVAEKTALLVELKRRLQLASDTGNLSDKTRYGKLIEEMSSVVP